MRIRGSLVQLSVTVIFRAVFRPSTLIYVIYEFLQCKDSIG